MYTIAESVVAVSVRFKTDEKQVVVCNFVFNCTAVSGQVCRRDRFQHLSGLRSVLVV